MENPLIPTNYLPKEFPLNILTATDASISRTLSKLAGRDYAETSRRSILFDLRAFAEWYQEKNGEQLTLQRVAMRDIADFRDDSRKAGLSVATVNRRLIMVRQFLQCAVEEGVITSNPAKGIKPLSSQSLQPKSLTSQQIRKFLREVELRKKPRDMAICELFLGAGLRLSELTALHVSDIQITERKGSVTVKNGKGNKSRIVPLGQTVREAVKIYLERTKPIDRLFPITNATIQKMIAKYGKRAELKLHPHMLRHTFATTFMQCTQGDLVGLGQLLGHSSIRTTQIYTQQRMEDLEAKIELMRY